MKYNVAILTISDRASAGVYEDKSGEELKRLSKDFGFIIHSKKIIPDEIEIIKENLIKLSNDNVSLILTTGGTGISKRDVTVDATKDVIVKEILGIGEMMRIEGSKYTKRSYLSRATAGVRLNTLIINMPGSLKACRENFDIIKDILIHALDTINGVDKHE